MLEIYNVDIYTNTIKCCGSFREEMHEVIIIGAN